MSFVDNFLEATATLPRKVVRILKLYLTVEQRAKNIEDNLKILREKYLKDLKEDKIENSEFILYTNEKYYKELLNLSDYKQNLIDELKYVLKYKFINKIEQLPIFDYTFFSYYFFLFFSFYYLHYDSYFLYYSTYYHYYFPSY